MVVLFLNAKGLRGKYIFQQVQLQLNTNFTQQSMLLQLACYSLLFPNKLKFIGRITFLSPWLFLCSVWSSFILVLRPFIER